MRATKPTHVAVPRVMLMLLLGARVTSAQDCTATTTRTTLHGFDSAIIRNVTVATGAPFQSPLMPRRLVAMRRTTEARLVLRQLLFKPGERIDTLRIAETLRRLRAQRLYADVALEARRCAGSDSVDLWLSTRDLWTLHPLARIVPPNQISIGAEDRNVAGTGQSVQITSDQTMRGHGGMVAYTNPWLGGTDILTGFRFSDVAGNHLARAFVRHHEVSQFDPWRVEGAVSRQTFSGAALTSQLLGIRGRAVFATAEIGHLVGHSRVAVTVPYIGVQFDSAVLTASRPAIAGDSLVVRRFLGGELGVLHRTTAFDTVGLFAPSRGFLDIPIGFEGDVVAAPGRDDATGRFVTRYDTWIGRAFVPERGLLVVFDAWASGYAGQPRGNRIQRVAFGGYASAPRGYWGTRMMVEQLADIDFDRRSLTLGTIANDPTLAAVPQAFRRANRLALFVVERAVHLRPVGRASMLDAAIFSGGSLRWDAPGKTSEQFAVGVLGARLRILSAHGVISSTRFDVSYPVAASGSVVHRPLLSVSLAPLFDVSRQRDGRRLQQ